MSTQIDENIVEMRFDNQQFERGARQTIGTINEIHNGIAGLGNASGSFKTLEKNARGLDFSPVLSALNSVKGGFSAMEVIAISALNRITNKVMAVGENMVRALTIEPLRTGLSEYEEKIDNIQTTLVNSGADLSTVNGILDDLNHYADKTIYKFSDMTTALGKFTIAGIDLNEAKDAIAGIGNAAAMSGLKASQASSAYYMISQAYQSGIMRLYQFRTLENSGFASREFRQNLIDNALALGTLRKAADGTVTTLKQAEDGTYKTTVTVENLRDSLDDLWLSKDVLHKTLMAYADDTTDLGKKAYAAAQDIKTFSQMWDTVKEAAQSGWGMNWQYIIGDFDQAKELWGGVNKVISGSLDNMFEKQQKILSYWNQTQSLFEMDNGKQFGMTGREYTIKAISNAFYSLMYALQPIKEAFREIFPALTGQRLTEFSKKLFELSGRFVLTDDALDKVRRTFKGLFSIMDTGKVIFGQFFSAIKPLFDALAWVPNKLLNFAAKIGDYLLKANAYVKGNNIFTWLSNGVNTLINFVKQNDIFNLNLRLTREQLKELWAVLKDIGKFGLNSIKGALNDIGNSLIKTFPYLKNTVDPLKKMWASLTSAQRVSLVVKALVTTVVNLITGVVQLSLAITRNLIKSLRDLRLTDVINFILSGTLMTSIASLIAQLSDILDPLGDLGSMVTNFREDLQIFLRGAQANILLKFGIALGVIAGSLIILSKVDPEGLVKAGFALTVLGAGLVFAMRHLLTFSVFLQKNPFGMAPILRSMSTMILSLSVSIGLLSVAVSAIGKLKWTEALQGVVGVEFLLWSFYGIIRALSKIDSLSETLIKGKGLFGGSTKTNSNINAFVKSLRSLAVTIALLVIPVKLFGSMDLIELGAGIGAVELLLGSLVGVLALLALIDSKFKSDLGGASKAMMELASALLIISIPFKLLEGMDFVSTMLPIIASLEIMMWSMLGLIAAINAVAKSFGSDIDDIKSIASSFMVLSVSLIPMALAIKKLDGMGLWSLAKSVGALEVLMWSFFGIVSKIDKQYILGSTLKDLSVSLIIFANALAVMAVSLRLLGGMGASVFTGALALTGLVGAFVLLGKFAYSDNVLALSGALIAFGVSITILTADLLLLSAVPFTDALGSVLILAGVIATISAASPALVSIAPAITAVGGALIVFGAGASLVSAAVLMLSASLYILVEAVAAAAEAGMDVTTGILGILDMILESTIFSEIGEKIAKSIYDGFGKFFKEHSLLEQLKNLEENRLKSQDDYIKLNPDKKYSGYDGAVRLRNDNPEPDADLNKAKEAEARRRYRESLMGSGGRGTGETIADEAEKAKTAVTKAEEAIIDETEANVVNFTSLLEQAKNILRSDKTFEEKIDDIKGLFNDGITDVSKIFKDKFDSNGIVNELSKVTDGISSGMDDMTKKVSEETAKMSEEAAKNASNTASSTEKTKTKLEEITEVVENQISIFKKLDRTVDMTADDMLQNMASNVLGMHEWANNLTKLAERGMNKDLLDELTMKGPEAYKEVAAFASMTAEQLNEANNLYLMYGRTQTLVEKQAKANIDYAGGKKNALANFLNPDGLFGLTESTIQDVQNALDYYAEQLSKSAPKSTKKLLKPAMEAINKEAPSLGMNLMLGFRDGIESYVTPVMVSIEEVGHRSINTLKKALDEHSPSKLTYALGEFFSLGFANGITGKSGEAVNVATVLSESTVEAIRQAYDAIENSDDVSPRIRPIIDLSEIQNGASSMNAMLSQRQAMMASIGYEANVAINRANAEALQINAVESAVNRIGDSIVSAIRESAASGQELKVTLSPNTSRFFDDMRVESRKFEKANGYKAFA